MRRNCMNWQVRTWTWILLLESYILLLSLAQVRILGTFSLTKEWAFIIRRTWN